MEGDWPREFKRLPTNPLYAEIDRLASELVIANNTITAMQKEINLLEQKQIVVTSLIRENEAMEREIEGLRVENATLKQERDRLGSKIDSICGIFADNRDSRYRIPFREKEAGDDRNG